MKEQPFTADLLHNHSQTLYSLLLKPIVESSVAWKEAAKDIKGLADCLLSYSEYLKNQAKIVDKYRDFVYPPKILKISLTCFL